MIIWLRIYNVGINHDCLWRKDLLWGKKLKCHKLLFWFKKAINFEREGLYCTKKERQVSRYFIWDGTRSPGKMKQLVGVEHLAFMQQ